MTTRQGNGWLFIVVVVVLSWAAFIYKSMTQPKESAFSRLLETATPATTSRFIWVQTEADPNLITAVNRKAPATFTDQDYADMRWTFSDQVQDTTEFCNPQGQCVTLGQIREWQWGKGVNVYYDNDGRIERKPR